MAEDYHTGSDLERVLSAVAWAFVSRHQGLHEMTSSKYKGANTPTYGKCTSVLAGAASRLTAGHSAPQAGSTLRGWLQAALSANTAHFRWHPTISSFI